MHEHKYVPWNNLFCTAINTIHGLIDVLRQMDLTIHGEIWNLIKQSIHLLTVKDLNVRSRM